MATYFKYAERSADSQVNWAEVGKGLTDMLAETNRVREEKKDALDKAQRETMKYIAETPNGEHVGARTSILEYSDQASNRMRIAEQLLKSGQMSPKDYTIFRQNIVDDTNLAFNANKAYQENFSVIMDRSRDGISSGLELNNAEEVEGFGDWRNIGWEIAPNGTVMAGKMVEQEIDGKKVRALNKNAGALRSMNYLNQAILGRIDKYDYQSQVKYFVDNLGVQKQAAITLGQLHKQGKITTVEDIKSRVDINPETKTVLFDFLSAENAKIKEIAGTNLDSARILYDSAKIAPNGKSYEITTNPDEAKKGEHYILKEVDIDSGGFTYNLTDAQKKDAEEFIRANLRSQYDYKEEVTVVSQRSRQDPPEYVSRQIQTKKEAENFGIQLGTAIKSGNVEEVANAVRYLAQKSERQVDRQGDKIIVRNLDGTGESVFNLNADPDKIAAAMVSAFGANLPEDIILKFASETLKGTPANTTAIARGITEAAPEIETVNVPVDIFTIKSVKAAANLENILPEGFTVEDAGGTFKNDVHVYAPGKSKADGDTPYIFNANINASEIPAAKEALEAFINANQGVLELD